MGFFIEDNMNRKCTRVKNGITYEVLVFPMDVINITQGCNGYYSHTKANAIDSAGKDTGKDPIFAPVTMKYITNDSYANGNAIYFQSVNPVLFADGTVDYATFMFIHDDYIGDVQALAAQGHIFEQGEECLDEGVAGMATGNHSHIEVAKGKYQGMYARENGSVWHLPGSISPDQAFVIDGKTLYNNGQPPAGLGNPMYWRKADEIPGITLQKVVNASGFSDVPENAYFFEAIKEAHALGIITGKTATEFFPLEAIKRGEIATMIYRLKGSPEVSQINPFTDVDSQAYYFKPVMYLTEKEITLGTGKNFRPNDSATRSEALTYLYRLCQSPAVDGDSPFSDVHEEDYFFKAVKWGFDNGIITGKENGLFDPYAKCSRADFVVMLMRTYHRKNQNQEG